MADCQRCGAPNAHYCDVCKETLCPSCRQTRLAEIKREMNRAGW